MGTKGIRKGMCLRVLGLALVLALSSGKALAETISHTKVVETTARGIDPVDNDRDNAKRWGLTENEWGRYKEILRGPQGTWTPGLTPYEILGLYAETDGERNKYAEMFVRENEKRAERDLAWTRAGAAAAVRMHGGQEIKYFDFQNVPGRSTPRKRSAISNTPVSPNRTSQPGDRVMFFTIIECKACSADLVRLVTKTKTKELSGVSVDVYVMGEVSDDTVRTWAQDLKIPLERVKAREVTLNHDNGTLSTLGGEPDRVALERGVIYRNRNGQTAALSHGELGL